MASRLRTVLPAAKKRREPGVFDSKPKTGGRRKAAALSEINILGSSADDNYNGSSVGKKRKINDDEMAPKLKCSANKLKLGDTLKEEKRLKPFRKQAPQSYLQRLNRVRTQRMFLIDRERKLSHDGMHEEEVFDIAGTTGNVYQITICKLPKCTCPDNQKGNQCKHVVYILVNVLKTPEPLSYQLAFLSTELTTIFANAPVTPLSTSNPASSAAEGSSPSNRKPIEGDCPICMMEFSPQGPSEEIIYCRAACGNNIHRQCFEQWAASKTGQGPVRCVYCRSLWQGDEKSMEIIKRTSKLAGRIGEDGYVNVANELGLSGQRDWSSYHRPWVERQQ